ncbi:MAG: alpha-L-fucosidase [Panacibacter sp.]
MARKLYIQYPGKIILLLLFYFSLLAVNGKAQEKSSADWLRKAKFGILVHYLHISQDEKEPWNMGKTTSWDSCVNDFDVKLFAKQMHAVGACYVIFTIYQGSKYMCIPNKTYEDITGYKRGEATSTRDLVSDLYDALSKYKIKLILYVTGDGTYKDARSYKVFQSPMLKWAQNKNQFIATEAWVNNWSKVLQDISLRYGDKVSGWWVDGAYSFHGYNDTLLGILSRALKAGNPKSIVGFNPSPQQHVQYYSKWDDYTAGEMYPLTSLPPAGGMINGVQWHVLTFLGKNWQDPAIRFTKNQLSTYISKCNAVGGVVSLDVCLLRNGSIDRDQFKFLKEVHKTLR